jgi:hypothetical protein
MGISPFIIIFGAAAVVAAVILLIRFRGRDAAKQTER